MKWQEIDRWRGKAELTFKILFLFYVMLGTCNLTYGKPIISPIMYAAFLLGMVICIWRALNFKKFLRMPYLIFPVLLLVSYGFSMVMNREYIIKETLVTGILWGLYFVILFPQEESRSFENVKKEFRIISVVYLIYVIGLVLISLWMLATGYSKAYRDPNNWQYEVASGFFSGRLWGAFQDPNLGSVMCCVAIALCGYWGRVIKKKWAWAGLILTSLIFLFYIALSDSRNGMVCMGVMAGVFVFVLWFYGKERAGWKYRVGGILIFLAATVGGVLLPGIVQNGYNAVVRMAREQKPVTPPDSQSSQETSVPETGTESSMPEVPPEVPVPPSEPPIVDRGYDLKGDISNRRFDVWRSGLEMGCSRLLTGVSFHGIIPYAKEHMPDTYIINNDYWELNTFDSELVNIFAAQGLPGILIVLLFGFCAIKEVITKVWRVNKHMILEIGVWIVIAAILTTSALFQGTMFYQSTPNTNLFWMVLGYLLFVLKKVPVKKYE